MWNPLGTKVSVSKASFPKGKTSEMSGLQRNPATRPSEDTISSQAAGADRKDLLGPIFRRSCFFLLLRGQEVVLFLYRIASPKFSGSNLNHGGERGE